MITALSEKPPRQLINETVRRFVLARKDPGLVVLEGFHPLKHALRFGAEVEVVAALRQGELGGLLQSHAPELATQVLAKTVWLERPDFRRMGSYEPHTGVVSLAKRPPYSCADLKRAPAAPLVAVEDPRHRGNLGAVVRVAAAAGAAGVAALGGVDPWHPTTVRGAVGLHFALPVVVLSFEQLAQSGRPLIGFDPAAAPLQLERIPAEAVLLFGSERTGLSADARKRLVAAAALPMRAGVSSLNLASAVAAVLYAMRLCKPPAPPAGA